MMLKLGHICGNDLHYCHTSGWMYSQMMALALCFLMRHCLWRSSSAQTNLSITLLNLPARLALTGVLQF